MSFMAQREGEGGGNDSCLGMAGGSQNYNVMCNQYLCDSYILESGIFILRLSLESVLETSLEGHERSEMAVVDLCPLSVCTS